MFAPNRIFSNQQKDIPLFIPKLISGYGAFMDFIHIVVLNIKL